MADATVMGLGRLATTKGVVATLGEGPLGLKISRRLPSKSQEGSRLALATPRRPTSSRTSAPATCRASPVPVGSCLRRPTQSPLVRCPEAVTVGMGIPVGPLA